jgi:hypothetical protein
MRVVPATKADPRSQGKYVESLRLYGSSVARRHEARLSATKPIIRGMNKPDHVFDGAILLGDCGGPLKVGVGGWHFGMQISRVSSQQAGERET